MHSTMMMPLVQLISIFILLPLLQVFCSGLVAKPGCPDRCGDLPIPYPFGVGSGCSMERSFDISCNTSSSTDPPKAYLSIIDKEVVEINQTYIRVHSNLISACYDLSQSQRTIVNLSGTPYTLSDRNRFTAIGCDDVVLRSDDLRLSDDGGGGGCSAFCADKNETGGGVGYCPFNGCCEAPINRGTSFVGAQLIDWSGKLQRRKLFPCSYAFLQEQRNENESIFSYPLYYLDNSTALLNDNWASASRPPLMRLDWTITGAENCSQAKLNSTTYACRDERSICVDDVYDAIEIGRGYLCMCVEGYEGNPYLPQGCQTISFSSSIAKAGCQDQCGKISIQFPFGVGPNCSLAPSFEVICNTTTNPPKAYLALLNSEIVELNSSKVLVTYPNVGWTCYNLSDNGTSKPEKRSLIVDLSRSQYTLSEQNWINAIGCDDTVVGVTVTGLGNNRSSIRSSCAAICSNEPIEWNSDARCPYGPDMYSGGRGCCKLTIPRGTTYLEANLSDLSGRWPRTNFACSHAFVQYDKDDRPHSMGYAIFNQPTEIMSWESSNRGWNELNMALDWRIGAVNCEEARRDKANFVCEANTDCVDYDATTEGVGVGVGIGIGGYLCNCSIGFQGTPYLSPGCLDIDECADNTTNTCDSTSICINNPGSYECSCPKGYFGNGRKDGTGCIQLPESKTKMISLIGVGSGLGFVLLLLMCFWLYKVLQKRKEKMVKEKFFKRNGGLLLQQQTNEGVLGQTKVFPSKELEVATDHFNESRILGQGGQGTVYKGMLSDGKIVAVKKSVLVEESQLEQFINEVAILSQINHRNVVRLLGCCLETEVPMLVYEFMPNGTLYELIHDPHNEFPFPWNTRLKVAADIAGALAYLHSASSMPIYHRDIKSSNILLDEKYVVKVADFGTSRTVAADQTHLTTMVKGTFGYLDPEYFQSSQFTEKSDVYSFGVVLVELLTGQMAISFDKTEKERGLAARFLKCMDENRLDTILDPQVLEHGKKQEVILVARLAERCLSLKGRMRPTMKEVANELDSYRISQTLSTCVNDESEDVRDFEDTPTMISDIEYMWTDSEKSAVASSSDTRPLRFATN